MNKTAQTSTLVGAALALALLTPTVLASSHTHEDHQKGPASGSQVMNHGQMDHGQMSHDKMMESMPHGDMNHEQMMNHGQMMQHGSKAAGQNAKTADTDRKDDQ
ncbi:hypothetical protein [Pseudomonas boanensis]|uniref:hypothetical protein n=1 Tax=Metapseudomonas boanensis TaxID=2822138 RepID=UPI0035D4DFA3